MGIISYPPDPGLYEIDDFGTETRLTTQAEVMRALVAGMLYESDGMTITKVCDLGSIGRVPTT